MNTKVINKLEIYVLHKSEIWSKITYCATAWEIFLWTFIRLISIHNDLSIVSFNEHEFQKFYVAWLCGQFKLICSFSKTFPNKHITKLDYLDYSWCEYFMIERNIWGWFGMEKQTKNRKSVNISSSIDVKRTLGRQLFQLTIVSCQLKLICLYDVPSKRIT